MIIGRGTGKARLIAEAGRFSLCARSEAPPHKHVSVEGPVVATEVLVTGDEARATAYRYPGAEFADLYPAASADTAAENCVVRMQPTSWSNADFGEEYGV